MNTEKRSIKYELSAQAIDGATVWSYKYYNTQKEALKAFDRVYSRRGFKIWIDKIDINAVHECNILNRKIIKSTYR